jgi:hypothetical protein
LELSKSGFAPKPQLRIADWGIFETLAQVTMPSCDSKHPAPRVHPAEES